MAGYSIDDILAELDAKNSGKPDPKKQEAPKEPPQPEEEKAPAETKKTDTISTTAILGSVVASDNSPSPAETVVAEGEKPEYFEKSSTRTDSTTEIDAITGTITDIDKVLFETDAFDRPEDKTEIVMKMAEEKNVPDVKDVPEDPEVIRQRELAQEEHRRLMLEKERENSDPDDMLDLVNPMEVKEKASRQVKDEEEVFMAVPESEEEVSTALNALSGNTIALEDDVKIAPDFGEKKAVQDQDAENDEDVKEYTVGETTDDLIGRLNKGIAKKRAENVRAHRTITLTTPPIKRDKPTIAAPLNIDYKKKIIQETGPIAGENPVVEAQKQSDLQAAKKHQLRDFVLEDDSVNEFPAETDEEEFDDYDSRGQIWADLCASHKGLKVRLVLLSIITAITFIISAMNDFGLFQALGITDGIGALSVRSGDITTITFIYLAAGILGFAICSTVISNGLIKLIKLCPDCDSVCSIVAAMSIIGGVICMVDGQSYRLGHCFIYVSTALVSLTLNTVGKMYMITRAKRNFKFVSSDNQKYYAQIISNQASVSVLTKITSGRMPVIAAMRKTEFLTDFLKSSYCDDEADKLSSRIVYGSLIAGLVVGIAAFFNLFGSQFANHVESESTIYWAVSAFIAVMTAACPFSMLFMVNAPLSRASRKLSESRTAILGYDAAMEFSSTDTIVTDAKALFPAGSVQIAKIKLWHKKNSVVKTSVEESILMAASLSIHSDGVLSYPFYDVMHGDKELIYPVDNCIYEDNCGVTGWIGTKRVMLGGRQLMQTHNIDLPSEKKESKYCPDDCEAVYLAVSGEIVALFVITLSANTEIKEQLKAVTSEGITVLVHATDSLVSVDNISRLFDVNPKYIRVLPHEAHEEYNECTRYTSRGSGAISCDGTFSSFTKGILAAKNLVRDFALSKAVLLGGALLGGFLATIMVLIKQTALITPTALTLYGLFTTLVMLCVQKMRKY